jgi:hypothetical protein
MGANGSPNSLGTWGSRLHPSADINIDLLKMRQIESLLLYWGGKADAVVDFNNHKYGYAVLKKYFMRFAAHSAEILFLLR